MMKTKYMNNATYAEIKLADAGYFLKNITDVEVEKGYRRQIYEYVRCQAFEISISDNTVTAEKKHPDDSVDETITFDTSQNSVGISSRYGKSVWIDGEVLSAIYQRTMELGITSFGLNFIDGKLLKKFDKTCKEIGFDREEVLERNIFNFVSKWERKKKKNRADKL